MPVLTFVNYLYSFTQGPYYRLLGRHTRRYCTRAAQKAGGEAAKRALAVAAVSADEALAPLLGVSRQGGSGSPPRKPKAAAVAAALRVYLSALLVALSDHKDTLLAKTGRGERDLLSLWCAVFEYSPEDMQTFDQELVPAYRRGGAAGLAAAAEVAIAARLGIEPPPEALTRPLAADAAAVLRSLGA